MAHLSISVSTQHGSVIDISGQIDGLLSCTIRTNIACGYDVSPGVPALQIYAKDVLNIHGTEADLRVFAERLLAALPEPAALCGVCGLLHTPPACSERG